MHAPTYPRTHTHTPTHTHARTHAYAHTHTHARAAHWQTSASPTIPQAYSMSFGRLCQHWQVQFAETLWQLLAAFPRAFEFNEAYLDHIIRASFSRMQGSREPSAHQCPLATAA